jgi:hypothetical protein
MKLFIKIVNGEIIDHPVLLENLQSAFPDFNPDSPPDPWVPFERIVQPFNTDTISFEFDQYVLGEDGVVRDTWKEIPIEPVIESSDTEKNTP